MCKHLTAAQKRTAPVQPSSRGCKECLESGSEWVELRLCITCGHVGCCDSSPNHHATRHHHATKHPVIKAFEPGANWGWCYVDEETVESIGAFPAESPDEHYSAPAAPHTHH